MPGAGLALPWTRHINNFRAIPLICAHPLTLTILLWVRKPSIIKNCDRDEKPLHHLWTSCCSNLNVIACFRYCVFTCLFLNIRFEKITIECLARGLNGVSVYYSYTCVHCALCIVHCTLRIARNMRLRNRQLIARSPASSSRDTHGPGWSSVDLGKLKCLWLWAWGISVTTIKLFWTGVGEAVLHVQYYHWERRFIKQPQKHARVYNTR